MPNPEPPKTLFIAEESPALPEGYYEILAKWSHRAVCIGAPWPDKDFFNYALKGKEDGKENSQVYYRKVVKIKATNNHESEDKGKPSS